MFHLIRGGGLWLLAVLALGCTHVPEQRLRLTSVEFTGNSSIEDDEIEEKIASHQTQRFLGVFPGVLYDYELFNRFVLERDLQRIERLYRSRGFYEARARAARVFRSGDKVSVEIVVEEGEPVTVRRVDIHGTEALPLELRERIAKVARKALRVGEVLDEEKFADAATEVARALANRGYAQATIQKRADVNLPARSASIGYWIDAGPSAELGRIELTGIGDLPEDRLRRALGFRTGDPYSLDDLEDGKRALLDLGVFSSVKIEPLAEPAKPGPNGRLQVPVRVAVELSKLRSVRLGGGLQFDTIKTDIHLTAGWEDRNFLGGLRSFLVEAVPGAVIYPTRLPSFEAPERLLPEGRVRVEFRAPGFLEKRTTAIVKGQVSLAPALLSSERDPEAPVLGYRDYRASVGADRAFRRFYGYLSENLQTNIPFAYVGNLNPALKPVVITYPSLLATLDLRNDSIHPHNGVYLAAEVQAAGPGDAHDVKTTAEIRGYLPLKRKLTLAGRAALGLLFARNYGDTVANNAATGESGLSGDPQSVLNAWVRDVQLMFFRGFFAGGAGSNRGYGAREIGPHGVIPYYVPGQAAEALADTCASSGEAVACHLPLGGFTLWEGSVELRYPVTGDLGGTLFVDAADVSAKVGLFRLRPHLSAGVGLRYETPVGPIRFDIGYRIPGLQAPAGAPDEGTRGEILSLPIAISFGIGESY